MATKRTQRSGKGSAAPTPLPPSPTPNGQAFVSTDYANQAGLDPKRPQAQLADARNLYKVISTTPWITQDQLVQWANDNFTGEAGIGAVDRLNSALAFLRASGRILSF